MQGVVPRRTALEPQRFTHLQENSMRNNQTLIRLLAAAMITGVGATAAVAAEPTPAPEGQATQMQASDDAAITTQVSTALQQDKDLAALPITVSAMDGVVVLKGAAPNADLAQRAVKLAQGVAGVKEVRSEIKLPS
jgi:osmotically-inducible protein OsmY